MSAHPADVQFPDTHILDGMRQNKDFKDKIPVSALGEQLRNGGFVIYITRASVERDYNELSWDGQSQNCASYAKNHLDSRGAEEAKQIQQGLIGAGLNHTIHS